MAYDPEAFDPDRKQRYELESKAVSPEGFRGLLQEARQNRFQPGRVSNHMVISSNKELIQGFIDRYYEVNNKLPEVEEIRKFVAHAFTPEYASKYESQGGVARDYTKYSLVDPYLKGLKEEEPPESIGTALSKNLEEISKLYDPLEKFGTEVVGRQFAPLRQRAIEEEAALGRLRSGVSAAQGSPIQQIDVEEGRALSEVIGNLLGQKAVGTLDLTKFGETLSAGERRAREAQNQFIQTLGFNKAQAKEQADYNRMLLKISEIIGRTQGGKSKGGIGSSILSGGLGGAATGGTVGGWPGALFGGVAGLGLGAAAGSID